MLITIPCALILHFCPNSTLFFLCRNRYELSILSGLAKFSVSTYFHFLNSVNSIFVFLESTPFGDFKSRFFSDWSTHVEMRGAEISNTQIAVRSFEFESKWIYPWKVWWSFSEYIQFMKTKSIGKIWNQWSHVIFENLNCKIASSIQFISCALLRVLLGEVPFYHESVVYIVTY